MAIDYQKVISDAFLNAVRHILSDTADNGLEPPTHFYITFRTNKKDVDIPDFLKQRYPDEMTIVLQHQFENLTVNDKAFSVDLSFNGQFWRLVVPFSALTAFADPSAQFALQFQPQADTETVVETAPEQTAQVIDLAALRDKK